MWRKKALVWGWWKCNLVYPLWETDQKLKVEQAESKVPFMYTFKGTKVRVSETHWNVMLITALAIRAKL